VKRFLLAAASALALCPAFAAELKPHPDVTDWFAGPLAPHLMAFDMDERGFARYPHDALDSYVNGASHQFWLRTGHQFEAGRESNHLDAGLRLSDRLAADFTYSKFHNGAFYFNHGADWFSAHGTADLTQDDLNTWEYGLGFATLQGDRSLWGPSLQGRWERKLPKPFTLYVRYAPTLLDDGRVWHELSAGLGANWKRIGVEAAYRTLLNPLRNSYGPELALRLWL
jgi:hypothetical protein